MGYGSMLGNARLSPLESKIIKVIIWIGISFIASIFLLLFRISVMVE